MWTPNDEHRLFYEVHKVLNRFARGVDRKDWDLVLSAFHDDAIDDHGAYTGPATGLVEAFKKGRNDVVSMMHTGSNISLLEIRPESKEVLTESYCVVWQKLDPESDEIPPQFDSPALAGRPTGPRLLSVGTRYLDLLSERDGELRISRRTVIYEWTDVAEIENRSMGVTGARSGDDASFTSIDRYRAG